MRIGLLATHPVQYYTPWFRELADRVDLQVYYAHDPSGRERGASGFDESFDWDVDLLSGYPHTFLPNEADPPRVDDRSFFGCDTPAIQDHIERGEFDAFITLGWHVKAYWQAVVGCYRTNTPVLARGDSQLDEAAPTWKRATKILTHRILVRAFDGFLAVGTRFEQYLRHYGVDDDRINRVPHCVDVDRFSQQADRARQNGDVSQLRAQFDVGDESVVFLFVGKMIPEKHPGAFLEAIRRASSDGLSVHGIMVGTGPLASELRERQKETDAPVHFAGFQNQTKLPAFYALADALVLPSRSETWGLVVNEAMACGTPAIVSAAAGCSPDMIEGRRTGYTFPAEDVTALTERIGQMARSVQRGESFENALSACTQAHSPATAAERTVDALRHFRDS